MCRFRKALLKEGNVFAEACRAEEGRCPVCGGSGWVHAAFFSPKTVYTAAFMCSCEFEKRTREQIEHLRAVLESPSHDRKTKKSAKSQLEKLEEGELRVWPHPTYQEYLSGYRTDGGKVVKKADPFPPEAVSRCACERENLLTKLQYRFIFGRKGDEKFKDFEKKAREVLGKYTGIKSKKVKRDEPIFMGLIPNKNRKGGKKNKEVKDADVKTGVPAQAQGAHNR